MPNLSPEAEARVAIDQQLQAAGWTVQGTQSKTDQLITTSHISEK